MILLFKHEGYEVMTSSWSACVVRDRLVIAYLWGADGLSIFDGATSVRKKQFDNMNLSQLWNEIALRAAAGVVDLREHS